MSTSSQPRDVINNLGDFSQPKIVWGNLSLTASYALVDKEYYVNAPSPMIVPASKYLWQY